MLPGWRLLRCLIARSSPELGWQGIMSDDRDTLMALCDRLKVRLVAAEDTCHLFMDALLAEALTQVEIREREAAE